MCKYRHNSLKILQHSNDKYYFDIIISLIVFDAIKLTLFDKISLTIIS